MRQKPLLKSLSARPVDLDPSIIAADCAGNLYIEHDAGGIEWLPASGELVEDFKAVTGQGRLAVSPDGWLVRIIPNPVQAAAFEE